MSPRHPFCSLVLPCYNERPNLAPLMEAFSAALAGPRWGGSFELIVVDNGPSDGTSEELARLAPSFPFLRTVRVEANRGYGYGITAGLKAARGDYAGWAHGDLQYEPREIVGAAEMLRGRRGEQVFLKGLRSARPAADSLFTVAMAVFESLLFGRKLYDINAQPTLFHRSLLNWWEGAPEDFSIDLFAYVLALEKGFRVMRVPMMLAPRAAGFSSWNRGFADRLRVALRTALGSFAVRRAVRAARLGL